MEEILTKLIRDPSGAKISTLTNPTNMETRSPTTRAKKGVLKEGRQCTGKALVGEDLFQEQPN